MAIDTELHPPSPIGIGDYLSVFSRRFWVIVIPFLGILGLAAGLAWVLPAQFEAETRVLVTDRDAIEDFYTSVEKTIPHKPYLSTIKEHIKRRSFVEPLVEKHGIREGFDYGSAKERSRLFQRVLKNLQVRMVEQTSGPNIIAISYSGRDAARVVRFVNDVRDTYMNDVLTHYKTDIKNVWSDLKAKTDQAKKGFQAAADALLKFKKRHGVHNIGDRVYGAKFKELGDRKNELAAAERNLEAREKALDSVVSKLNETPERVPGSTKKERNSAYVEQERRIATALRTLKDAEESYTPIHPKYLKARAELAIQEDKLKEIDEFTSTEFKDDQNEIWVRLKQQETDFESEIISERSRIQGLRSAITNLEEDVKKIPDLTREIEGLEEDQKDATLHLDRVERAFNAVDGFRNRVNSPEGNFFQPLIGPIPDEARNMDPVFPSIPLFLGVGGFVGLLVGVGMAFLVEFTSRSYVTVSQVRRTLPLPILGEVGVMRSPREVRKRVRNRVLVVTLVLLVLGSLTFAHVCYFNKGLQPKLPPWLFDVMRRLYGSH